MHKLVVRHSSETELSYFGKNEQNKKQTNFLKHCNYDVSVT